MNDYKKIICDFIDKNSQDIIDLSHEIHKYPELGFNEKKAVECQKKILQRNRFDFKSPFAGLSTAYRADYIAGTPTIAFIAEYDALKGIGHGCGHNIIAASSIGAAIGLSAVSKDVEAGVCVIGTPAEEAGGGKVIMSERGAFYSVDYSLSVHPRFENVVCRTQLYSSVVFSLYFYGKASHASKPHEGIDVTKAVIKLFNHLQDIKDSYAKTDTIINGVIIKSGSASNIIADFAECEFLILSETSEMVRSIHSNIMEAANKIAADTNNKLETESNPIYAETYLNRAMQERFKSNMQELGEVMKYGDPADKSGYSDIGNVSMLLPSIHEYIKIGDSPTHTEGFCKDAVSERADQAILLAAKGMALTAIDIILDEEFRTCIDQEFAKITAVPFQTI